MASQQCIVPNPDVSGIGVRIAIYVQSFLFILQAYMAVIDARVDEEEEQQLTSSWINSTLLIIGITLSAIIQAGLGNLSLNHGLIALNLCWIIVLSKYIPLVVLNWAIPARPRRRGDNTKTIFDILSIMLWSTLGLVVWVPVDPTDPCTQLTVYVILFKYAISPASRGLRIASLVIYALQLATAVFRTPLTILLIILKQLTVSSPARSPLGSFQDLHDPIVIWVNLLILFPIFTFYQAYFIGCTEIMIKKNAHLIIGGEGQDDLWTFGQTLALAMLFAPLLEFVKSVWREMKKRWRRRRAEPEMA